MGIRYNKFINGHSNREVVLLKGYPCKYGKCKFCNYIKDNSTNDEEIKQINNEVLSKITGEFNTLEILNSGSVFEIPKYTLEEIRRIVEEKNIRILYFEIYYGYIKRLKEIEEMFPKQIIRFKMGLETFDNDYRINTYGKNFSLYDKDYNQLGKKIYSICLLICTKGQTKQSIRNDIALGLKYFPHITINIFINNGTMVQRDDELVAWFIAEYQYLQNNPQIELLLDNKDLGVFEQ